MLGVIMSEPSGRITDAMLNELDRLNAKPVLTDIQEKKRIELQFRLDTFDPKKLSGTCIKYLMFLYCYHKYGPQYKLRGGVSKGISQLEKGKYSEPSSFALIKRVTGRNLYRCKVNISNKYLKGRMDVIDAPTIKEANSVIDIKGHQGWIDFIPSVTKENIDRKDDFQLQGYMDISGKDFGEIYHCLSDFSEEDIQTQYEILAKSMCPDGVLTDDFQEEWVMVENAMKYSKVPDIDRVTHFETQKDRKIIDRIYEKVEFCREWLSEFEQKHARKVGGQALLWNVNTY